MSEDGKKGGIFLLEETNPEEVFTPEDFSEEQKMLAHTAEEFMEREVLPRSDEIEKKNFDVLLSLLRKAGELGLLSIDIPEKYEGLGLDKVSSMLIAEKMSKQGSFSVTWGAHTGIGTLPFVFFGTEEQKRKYLPKLATGEWIGAYALTEPEAGSDAMSIKTRATLSDDGKYYILNGTKQFITNAGFADIFIVFAKIDGEKFTAFIIHRDTPGLTIGPEEHKLGIRGSSTCNLILEDVKVPIENILGEIGKGHYIAFNILNIGRYKLGVGAVGAAKDALEKAINYVKERIQFGKPLIEFGLIRKKIADMTVRIFAAESMAYRIAGLLDKILKEVDPEDEEYSRKVMDRIAEYAIECSILKVYGSEMLDFVADETVQLFGGYGYSEEYPAERYYRDSRINRIFEGTNEINRLLIPGMLMRRAIKGTIPLIPAAQRMAKEFLSFTPSSIQIPEGPIGQERTAVEILKKIFLLIAGVAAQRYKENLKDEQEVLEVLADIIMEIFASESIILRVEKNLLRNGENLELMENVAKVYIPYSFMKVESLARSILPTISKGDDLRTLLSAIRKFTRWYLPEDGVTLKRKIANSVRERGKYPF
jgi:alkylation response protein AidB-like acyl-CoA dehydrogenase